MRGQDSEWIAEAPAPVSEWTVGDLLRSAASDSPGAISLTEGSGHQSPRRWTYAEVLEQSEKLARHLLTRFEVGDRVVLWAGSSPEWVILGWAMGLAGLVVVPANPACRAAELEYVVDRSGAVGIVAGQPYRGQDLLSVASDTAARVPRVRFVLKLGWWEESGFALEDDAVALPDVRPEDIAILQFTSGTTGKPKGALLQHRAIVNTAKFYVLGFGLDTGGAWLNPFPLFHVGGWVCGTLAPVWLRMNQVLPERIEAGLLLQLLESERVRCAIFVPTMVLDILNHPEFTSRDLTSLTFINCGSTAVAPELIRRVETDMECAITIAFGQTEASGVITQSVVSDSAEDKVLTIGRPMAHANVRIVDPATGLVAGVGEVGEICVRGYQVMAGYDQMPKETGESIDSEGFLHTGDLGTMDSRGYLRIVGRIKDMIIRGAENVYPQEIEYRLVEHASVSAAAVVGIPDERLGESVAAVVVLDPSKPRPTAVELVQWCRETLSTIKVPTAWFVSTQLPLTASSKVRKDEVAAAILDKRLEHL